MTCYHLYLCRFVGNNKLSDLLLQPYDLLKPGWADSYVFGMINQVRKLKVNLVQLTTPV
jgi:hypothetical protein